MIHRFIVCLQSSYTGEDQFDVGSFPKDFGYGPLDGETGPGPDDQVPRILLMGLRQSGKSSIQKVCLVS